MPDEGEAIHAEHMEQQSTAGSGSCFFGDYFRRRDRVWPHNHATARRQADQGSERQSSPGRGTAKRMQSAEAQDETLGQKLGMTKKELASAPPNSRRNNEAPNPSGERSEGAGQQIGQVSGEVAGSRPTWRGEDRFGPPSRPLRLRVALGPILGRPHRSSPRPRRS